MTFNQIQNSARIEDARHNKSTEAENERHNLAWENESARHNLASEGEIYRSNRAREALEQQRLSNAMKQHEDNLAQGYHKLSLDAWRNQSVDRNTRQANAIRATQVRNEYALGQARNAIEQGRLDESVRSNIHREQEQFRSNKVYEQEQRRHNKEVEGLAERKQSHFENTVYPHQKHMDWWANFNGSWRNHVSNKKANADSIRGVASLVSAFE